jgi:predicted Fe-Mo cluster-binding NifX family protein
MKLAIATDDKQTIPRGHFGESRYFCIVGILDHRLFTEECRPNPGPDHGMSRKSERILELLQDCDAFVGRGFGARSFARVARERKQMLLTTHERIEDAVRDVRDRNLGRFRQFDPGAGRFVAMEKTPPPRGTRDASTRDRTAPPQTRSKERGRDTTRHPHRGSGQ